MDTRCGNAPVAQAARKCLLTAPSMALSPTGIPLDWDCSSALEALLAEDADGESVPTELQGVGFRSPLYSPAFSDASSGADSGFVTPLTSQEDQLLAGLFGPDCPLFCDPSTTSVPPSIPAPSSSCSSDFPSINRPTTAVLAPSKQNHQNMFESGEFETTTLSPSPSPPPRVCAATDAKKNAGNPLDRSRKNAEAARQNRLKKKKYMEDLERDRSRLKADNVIMKTRCTELQTKNKKLETEVAYLRSVLANQSTLASLIKNIPGTPGVNLTSSFSRKRPSDSSDVGPTTQSSKRPRSNSSNSSQMSGGVCLHVSKDNVSLEFCSQCSLKAAQT